MIGWYEQISANIELDIFTLNSEPILHTSNLHEMSLFDTKKEVQVFDTCIHVNHQEG